jgi:hypothetical protein
MSVRGSIPLASAILVVALALGCSAWSPVSSSGTPQEELVLSETLRFAMVLGVKVHGELTDSIYWVKEYNPYYVGEPTYAAGWYQNGVCYYYRPWVVRQEVSVMSSLAAHEVCHSQSLNHDQQHSQCVERLLGGRL